ncbi:MAG: NAD(P)/FAD-dependent oxidoreductase [Acidobacteriota bacterium]
MTDRRQEEDATRGDFPAEVDAVVCGGGPGGSTFATLMARMGHSTVVFEREKFPRFHIGESLLPWNVPLFERLGVLSKLQTSGFQVKRGARFYHQGSSLTRPVLFANGVDSDHPSSFQVKRAEFDTLLLDHARESGAAVFEETRVTEVLFTTDGKRARGVNVLLKGESAPRTVDAKLVVDATGRDALLSRHLGGRRRDPLLDRSAAFAHYDTFRRAEGPTGGDIVIVTTPEGWWWLIPFSDGSVSVGIVMPSRRFKERKGTVDQLFEESVRAAPEVRELLAGSTRTMDVQAIADYSYATPRISGDGFCLVGDAACFLDPVFSTGVLLAMSSAELAAEAASRALRAKGRVDANDFRRFERTYRGAIRQFERFVHGFYEPHVLETFYTPAPNARIERGVTTVLGGGVFHPTLEARFWMFAFHASAALIRIQQAFRGRGAFERATGILESEKAR